MTLRAAKVPSSGASTPHCVAQVKVSSVDTVTRRGRAYRQEQRGLPIDQCGDYATWTVDGRPLCLPHAGRAALAVLAGEQP